MSEQNFSDAEGNAADVAKAGAELAAAAVQPVAFGQLGRGVKAESARKLVSEAAARGELLSGTDAVARVAGARQIAA